MVTSHQKDLGGVEDPGMYGHGLACSTLYGTLYGGGPFVPCPEWYDLDTPIYTGRMKGKERKIERKERVGFDRPELSLRLPGIVFCALSYGHRPRNTCFSGFAKVRIHD